MLHALCSSRTFGIGLVAMTSVIYACSDWEIVCCSSYDVTSLIAILYVICLRLITVLILRITNDMKPSVAGCFPHVSPFHLLILQA
jgi:hypothetical protein